MIKGIGLDAVDVLRVKNSIAKKVLSAEEREEFEKLPLSQQSLFLATRFAVKEALFKATQTSLSMNQVTLFHQFNGQPVIREFPKAFVTITHEAHLVIALVIIEEN